MAIKLIKACKELNIGMATLITWCERNGHYIESDPNYRLSDELFALLEQTFKRTPSIVSTPTEPNKEGDVFGLSSRLIPVTAPKTETKTDHVRSNFQRKPHRIPNSQIEEALKEIPISYGTVSLFPDGHYGFQAYGLVSDEKGNESFYHTNNCLPGEEVNNGDFVVYKATKDPKKGRLTAYLIRHPKEEDGYSFIMEYAYGENRSKHSLTSDKFIKALIPYSKKHWALAEDYTQIISDAKAFLLRCNSEKDFESLCKALPRIKALGNNDTIPSAYWNKLIELILVEFDNEKLANLFKHTLIANDLWYHINDLQDLRIVEVLAKTYLSGDFRSKANLIIEKESIGADTQLINLLKRCFYEVHEHLDDNSKVCLYLNGFDEELRNSLPEELIVKELSHYDATRIISYYSNHKHEKLLVIRSCCEFLRSHPGYEGSICLSYIDKWSESMPELIPEIKSLLAQKIDDAYLRLWKNGIVDVSPTMDDWLRLMNVSNENAIESIKSWLRWEYINHEQAGDIINEWYRANMALTKDSLEERFAYDHLLFRKFQELEASKFIIPKVDSEYLPIIQWYENVVLGDSQDKEINFEWLSKYYYLFTEQEQVKILRYIFHLIEEGELEKDADILKVLSSTCQQQKNGNAQIHVCYDVDLVVEALVKFQKQGEFMIERDLLTLLLTTLRNDDFRERSHPLIYQLFDNCSGLEWRKLVDVYNENGYPTGGKKLIERNYGRPYGVIFCEGRELEKKDETGKTRFLCRNNYCAKNNIVRHSHWTEYTMYDFCLILGFDLSEVDRAGYKCENGKYLKFVTLINRFNQFAKHLFCRECGRLMLPSIGLTNLGLTVSSHYECKNSVCTQRGIRIYLSHCLNPECQEPIDERDAAKCPNGWVICNKCATCCSHQVFYRRYLFLREHRPNTITNELINAVNEHKGHLEKEEYYCPVCGKLLQPVSDRSDIDHVCTNPDCLATYSINNVHRKRR